MSDKNLPKNNYFEDEYLPYIIKWGKRTNWLGVLLCFGPAIVLALVYKLIPPFSAILTGFISIASAAGVLWIIEPVSYFPIVGVAGTYMAFVSGNISNLRIPTAAVAQNVAGVEPGSPEGSIISTLGMGTSVLVNTVILAVGVFFGSSVLQKLPANVVQSFDYLLPALFGAIFVQFALKQLKLAPVGLGLGIVLTLGANKGLFPGYIVTIGAVFITILTGVALYKKKIIK